MSNGCNEIAPPAATQFNATAQTLQLPAGAKVIADAILEAEDQVVRLETQACGSYVHKRKCHEVLRSARRSLACLLEAQHTPTADPVAVLLSARRLAVVATRACDALQPCVAAGESAWRRGVAALRRQALWRELSSVQYALEGSIDLELQQQLLAAQGVEQNWMYAPERQDDTAVAGSCSGRRSADISSGGSEAWTEQDGLHRRSDEAVTASCRRSRTEGGAACATVRHVGARRQAGDGGSACGRRPEAWSDAGTCAANPYRSLLWLGSSRHGAASSSPSLQGVFEAGTIRPSDGRSPIERVWLLPTTPLPPRRPTREGRQPARQPDVCREPQNVCPHGLDPDGAFTSTSCPKAASTICTERDGLDCASQCGPTVLMAVVGGQAGKPVIGLPRSSHQSSMPHGGQTSSLLAYSSSLRGFNSCLPFATAAERIRAAAVDRSSCKLYTGHGDGSVSTCAYTQPEVQPASYGCSNTAITAMAMEEPGRLWLGDEAGRLISFTLQPFSTHMLNPFAKDADSGERGDCTDSNNNLQPDGSKASVASASRSLPKAVTAVITHEGLVFTASAQGSLAVITSCDRHVHAVSNVLAAYGSVTALAIVPWCDEIIQSADAGCGSALQSAPALAPEPALQRCSLPVGSSASMPRPQAGSAPDGVDASSRESGLAAYAVQLVSGGGASKARDEVMEADVADGTAPTAASNSVALPCTSQAQQGSSQRSARTPSELGPQPALQPGECHASEEQNGPHSPCEVSFRGAEKAPGAASSQPQRRSWRLLTGTSQGAVLLWDAAGGRLNLVACVLTVPGPSRSPDSQAIRGLFVYPEMGLLVAGCAGGTLNLSAIPRLSDLPPSSQADRVGLHSAAAGDVSAPKGTSFVPSLRMPSVAMRAHKGRLTAVDACGLRLASGGAAGAIKVWDVLELRRSAVQQGLPLPPLPPHLHAVDAAAVAAAAPTKGRRFASTVGQEPVSQAAISQPAAPPKQEDAYVVSSVGVEDPVGGSPLDAASTSVDTTVLVLSLHTMAGGHGSRRATGTSIKGAAAGPAMEGAEVDSGPETSKLPVEAARAEAADQELPEEQTSVKAPVQAPAEPLHETLSDVLAVAAESEAAASPFAFIAKAIAGADLGVEAAPLAVQLPGPALPAVGGSATSPGSAMSAGGDTNTAALGSSRGEISSPGLGVSSFARAAGAIAAAAAVGAPASGPRPNLSPSPEGVQRVQANHANAAYQRPCAPGNPGAAASPGDRTSAYTPLSQSPRLPQQAVPALAVANALPSPNGVAPSTAGSGAPHGVLATETSPFSQATQAAADAAGTSSPIASASGGSATTTPRERSDLPRAASPSQLSTADGAPPIGQGPSPRPHGRRRTAPRVSFNAGMVPSTSAGGFGSGTTAAGGGLHVRGLPPGGRSGSGGSGGTASSHYPSPSSSQLQLAATASNPSGPVNMGGAPSSSPSGAFFGSMPSGAFAAARAIAAATGNYFTTGVLPHAAAGTGSPMTGAMPAYGHAPNYFGSMGMPMPMGVGFASPYNSPRSTAHTALGFGPGPMLDRSSPNGARGLSMGGASVTSLGPPGFGLGLGVSQSFGDAYGVPGSPYGLSYDQAHVAGGSLARHASTTIIRRADLHFIGEIGSGAEGRVWRARWQHIDVAVKEMFPKANSSFGRVAGARRNSCTSSIVGGGPLPPPGAASPHNGLSRAPTMPTSGFDCRGSAPSIPALAAGARPPFDASPQRLRPPQTGHAPPDHPFSPPAGRAAGGPPSLHLHPHPHQQSGQPGQQQAGGSEASLSLPSSSTTAGLGAGSGGASAGGYSGGGAGAGPEVAGDVDLASVMKEVRALAQLSQHPNIVRFIGLCIEQPLIVTEYYPRGCLFDLLRRASAGDRESAALLEWPHRLAMLHDVAAGMSYLHAQNYLHGDLRSPNIFVVQADRVKIGDFGYAKLLGDGGRGSTSTSASANPRWVAPEALQVGRVTRSADVFSFAIVMWELLTWDIPYDEYNAFQIIMRKAREPGFRPRVPPRDQLPGLPPWADLDGYCGLMRHCWEYDPTARPTFDAIAERLDRLKTGCGEALRGLRRSEGAAAFSGAGGPVGHPGSASTALSPAQSATPRAGSATSSLAQAQPGGGGSFSARHEAPSTVPQRRAASGTTVAQYPNMPPPHERSSSGGGAPGGVGISAHGSRGGARIGPSLLGQSSSQAYGLTSRISAQRQASGSLPLGSPTAAATASGAVSPRQQTMDGRGVGGRRASGSALPSGAAQHGIQDHGTALAERMRAPQPPGLHGLTGTAAETGALEGARAAHPPPGVTGLSQHNPTAAAEAVARVTAVTGVGEGTEMAASPAGLLATPFGKAAAMSAVAPGAPGSPATRDFQQQVSSDQLYSARRSGGGGGLLPERPAASPGHHKHLLGGEAAASRADACEQHQHTGSEAVVAPSVRSGVLWQGLPGDEVRARTDAAPDGGALASPFADLALVLGLQ